MVKLKIVSVGKNKERWLEEALAEYKKRLTRMALLEFFFFSNNEQLENMVRKEKNLIILDSQGKLIDSTDFAYF